MSTYFPPLPEGLRGHLETIRLHLIETPDYLQSTDCPYPAELSAYLEGLLGQTTSRGGAVAPSEDGETQQTSGYSADDLLSEAESLFRELEEFGNKVKEGAANEQASYFRVAAALLEKILTAKERAANLKDFGRLISFLTQFAEDEMSIDQRTKFMDRLKAFSAQ